MNDKEYSIKNLVSLQTYGWYFVLLYFGCAVALDVLQIPLPFNAGMYGVLSVILITVLKIVVLAEKFRKLHLLRFMMLSYLLILILALTIAIRLF